MIYVGNHLSSSKGFLAMGKEASSLGGDTFAFFTRNPRGGKAAAIDKADARGLMEYLQKNGFGPLVAHAPYTMNLCSDKESIREFALQMLADDLQNRMECLPGQYYNFHPGSHVGQGVDRAIEQITEALNRCMFEEMHTTVLLETMAGKGSEVGATFEQLREIMEGVKYTEHLGVCLDTCHIWDAGYDIVDHLDEVLEEFDRIIGLSNLKAVHINDSMNPCGSHKDRHEKIGQGCIGGEAMERIVRHPYLQGLSFILETPNDNPGYAAEIHMLKAWNAQ